jgi:hypothetical protein
MNSKLLNIFAAILVSFALFGMPMITYAQELPAGLEGETTIPNLPNDLVDGETTDNSTTTESKPLTQREDFIAGVGVGVAFGIIVGGVIIWFTKKS